MVSLVSYRLLPGYELKWDGVCVPNGMEDNDNGDLYLYVHNIYNIDVWVFDVMMMVFYSFCLRSFGRWFEG